MEYGNRKVEIFSAGCPVCRDTIDIVSGLACPSCEVTVHDMNDPAVAQRARKAGVRSLPAIVIDDRLVDCCSGRGPDQATLRRAGLGQPLA